MSTRATCCSPSTAARSRRRSRRPKAPIARDQAQLAGAERDVARYTDLVAKNATPVVNLDNAKTQADVYRAAIKADQGLLENLKVQLSYCTITRADLRPHQRGQRQGRQFRAPGRHRADGDHQPDGAGLCQLHGAAEGPAGYPPGARRRRPPPSRPSFRASTSAPTARSRMIENTVDAATGMATIRATMPNKDESAVAGHAGHRRIDAAQRGGGGGADQRGAGQPDRHLRLRGREQRRQGAPVESRAPGRRRNGDRRPASRAARPSSPTASCCCRTARGCHRARPQRRARPRPAPGPDP